MRAVFIWQTSAAESRILDHEEPLEPVECLRLRARSRRQLVEQRLSVLQILRVKPFGEPTVDRSEQFAGFALAALLPHQPRIAGRGPQLPGFRLLFSRPVERGDVSALRAYGVSSQALMRSASA